MDQVVWALIFSVNFFIGVVCGMVWYGRRLVAKTEFMNRGCQDVADCLHVHLSEKIINQGVRK